MVNPNELECEGKETIPQIKITEITDDGKTGEEITLVGRNALIIFEAVKIAERLSTKGCYMENEAILNIASIIG